MTYMFSIPRSVTNKPHLFKRDGKWHIMYHEGRCQFSLLYRTKAAIDYHNNFGKWPETRLLVRGD